jgi:hypothetical protein
MDQMPPSPPNNPLTPRRLKLAGYFAMGSALLTLPWFMYTLFVASRTDPAIKASEASMQVGSLALLIYLLLTFRQLLHQQHSFHHADKTISLIIQANIVQTMAALLPLAFPELAGGAGIFAVIMLVVDGILHIMFGIWLLQLPDSLGGMHRPYCYLNMVSGFAFATIMLLPLGVLLSTIADIMLGTIFMQAGRPRRETG